MGLGEAHVINSSLAIGFDFPIESGGIIEVTVNVTSTRESKHVFRPQFSEEEGGGAWACGIW